MSLYALAKASVKCHCSITTYEAHVSAYRCSWYVCATLLASSPQSRSSSSNNTPAHRRARSSSTSNTAAAAATDEAIAADSDNSGTSPTADVSSDVADEQESAQPLCMPPTRQREYVLRCYSSSYVHGDVAAHGSAFEHDDHTVDSSSGGSSSSTVEHCSAPPSRLYACTDGTSLRLALALCESEL
jgi:hypothetical protein